MHGVLFHLPAVGSHFLSAHFTNKTSKYNEQHVWQMWCMRERRRKTYL